jgi:sigma-B regulation protein RsbU (phosphoserine phosphatase)
MGILDLTTGQVKFANAGHNPPLLKRANGSFEYLKTRAGFVLAGMEGIRYRIGELTLYPGDRLFLYTDGVPEANNSAHELFGNERMLTSLDRSLRELGGDQETDDMDLYLFLRAVREQIDDFVGETPQFDDLTMLCLEYRGPGKPGKVSNLARNA